jgi:hypothetical protein
MDIFILRNGEQTGPFSEQTVQTLLSQGGVRSQDMAWRKGLPAWLPVSEVLNPGSQKPSEPPPAVQVSGVREAAPAAQKAPTAKQKALLKYLGVEFAESASREALAIAISDALENPKFQARFSKWGEEKLRLHPDIFADEIEQRKAGRPVAYVERCQTEGEAVVKGVTKAHCQVLVESLDKRYPAWESNAKEALWNYFLPAIAEHFPTLVRDEWRSKLRMGSAPKGAATTGAIGGGATHNATPTPSPLAAAFRGIVYGLAALGLIIGGMQIFKKDGNAPVESNVAAAPTPAPAPVTPPAPKSPLDAAPIAAAEPPPAIPQPEPAPAEPAAPVPVAPVPAPEPAVAATTPPPSAPPMAEPAAPATPPVVPVNPVPPGPPSLPRMDTAGTPPPATPTPPAAPTTITAPPAPAAPKSMLTLTKPVNIQLQFGKVTLQPGTKMKFLSVDAAGLKCNFNNNIVVVPASSTDYDGPMTVTAPSGIPAGLPVTPGAPATPPAPKPVNASDL